MAGMKLLLMTPPMTQLNTPYPATAYLTGFLKTQNYQVAQRDIAIELLLKVLTRSGLLTIYALIEQRFEAVDDDELPDVIYAFLADFQRYVNGVEPVVRFLQGQDPSLAIRIASRTFLPEGPRFDVIGDMESTQGDVLGAAFGQLGIQDRAKFLATLFIDDLCAVIQEGVDPFFEVTRYGEQLAASNPQFDDLYRELQNGSGYLDRLMEGLVNEALEQEQPSVVGITVPFPGNMLGALKIAHFCRLKDPAIKIVLGGGFVNTELRQLKEPRLFEYVDYICLDDGERPLLTLLEHLQGDRQQSELVRTFYLKNAQVHFNQNLSLHDIPHKSVETPSYEGLPLKRYLSLCEMLNPMHRIWSDGRWNKLTLAHGCYWAQCSFCDISLNYIGQYDEAGADIIIERIEALIAETGVTGFHFVDEAAPPKVMFALAKRLIEKNLVISWWGNIRFEKTFTPEKCQLLADSGCIAISGGLEVASDRLLTLMKKGVTVEQVARVTKGFANAGILVHAYLMYGFPTQTEQETVDSLERVRQLMAQNCIHSAYWHRFAATIHSPVGQQPEDYQITLIPNENVLFAENDIQYQDSVNTDHARLGLGLKKALYNYMHGIGFDYPVETWFETPVNKTTVPSDLIEKATALIEPIQNSYEND